MKRKIIAAIVAGFFLCAAGLFAAPAAGHDYRGELQTQQFRPHGGDKAELSAFFASLVAALNKNTATDAFLAVDAAEWGSAARYLAAIRAEGSVDIIASTVEKLYTVEDADEYTNYRAIVKFKFLTRASDGTLLERTDYLGLAKLGKHEDDWKLWGIVWSDTGINVADADLSQLDMPKKGEEICLMTTDAGIIKMRLFPDKTPKTVQNFKALAQQGFYNNTAFLRVYDNFMIQGGALDGTKEVEISSFGGFFEDEFSRDLFNFRGALCMGNAGPHTNANQIYIVQSPIVDPMYLELSSLPLNAEAKYKEVGGRAYLDKRYTVFGQVFEGISVVDTIARQKADDDGRPLANPIKILKVEFMRY